MLLYTQCSVWMWWSFRGCMARKAGEFAFPIRFAEGMGCRTSDKVQSRDATSWLSTGWRNAASWSSGKSNARSAPGQQLIWATPAPQDEDVVLLGLLSYKHWVRRPSFSETISHASLEIAIPISLWIFISVSVLRKSSVPSNIQQAPHFPCVVKAFLGTAVFRSDVWYPHPPDSWPINTITFAQSSGSNYPHVFHTYST